MTELVSVSHYSLTWGQACKSPGFLHLREVISFLMPRFFYGKYKNLKTWITKIWSTWWKIRVLAAPNKKSQMSGTSKGPQPVAEFPKNRSWLFLSNFFFAGTFLTKNFYFSIILLVASKILSSINASLCQPMMTQDTHFNSFSMLLFDNCYVIFPVILSVCQLSNKLGAKNSIILKRNYETRRNRK